MKGAPLTTVAEPMDRVPSAGGSASDLGEKDTSAASEVLDLSSSWLLEEVSDANETSSDDEMASKRTSENPPSFIRPEKKKSDNDKKDDKNEKSFAQCYKKDVTLGDEIRPSEEFHFVMFTECYSADEEN